METQSRTTHVRIGPPTRRSVMRFALWAVAIGAGYVIAVTVLETPFAPWARSFGFWPTLTGDWHGEVTTPDGQTTPIYLEIRHELPIGRCRGCTSLFEGRAKTCESRGAVRDFDVSGSVDNWSGTRFMFQLSRGEGFSGKGPGDVRGEWKDDAIRAIAELVTYGHTATAEAVRGEDRTSPPQIRYALRRGTEDDFLAACKASR
jgi:hypothetical protein